MQHLVFKYFEKRKSGVKSLIMDKKLSNASTHGGKCMKKTRRRYNRDFKISILAELEAGKPLAQVAHE
jgi:transposase-like protein